MYGSTPWSDALMAKLEQGPVEKEAVLATLIGLVPPGRAWRVYVTTLQNNRNKRRRAMGLDIEDTEEELRREQANVTEEGIRGGARQIVVGAVNSMKRRGRIEEYADGGRNYYRKLRDVEVADAEEYRRRALKAAAHMTPEQRSERSRSMWKNMSPEKRSEHMKKVSRTLNREQQSARSQQWWDNATPEERAERARQVAEGIRRARTPDELSRIAKDRHVTRDPEKREQWRQTQREVWASIPPEVRSARARKGAETRRRRAWFREGSQGTGEDVSTGPEGGDEPDQQDREGGADRHHAEAMG